MTFQIYRKGVGVYARCAVAGLFGLATIFAAYSLYGALIGLPEFFAGARIPLLDVRLTWGVVSACILFVFFGMLIGVFTLGFEVGLRWIDKKSKGAIEFFIETQAELQKVSWPTQNQLIGSTIVVIIFLIVLSLYILGVDWIVSTVMETVGIL
ncbi:MAG: putative preprotein translocase SecE subunit [Candidatus Scalindua rubra]|uniref:Protein translocase subunit SecE n=1 Tax=Candidatus Scalindua rubra TaxID=1872076 RepID=A0A1E3X3A9_9BACT|nr:MAG: putative preprotein translocase SecE subunit [Candidatus Scalindua rubra]